ncbi:DUF6148 family protein [Chengkuizengella axinellae]|uniref:DUF6148 family protein n=1 Tax=Chengkuizengella axinellae TaxID=3064388 RepID=A0ABT9J6Q7_9BACL|nr:DUF6148 family protein [Chengkuizengella sp. 2205SS18-9]MDP5277153.1 DUF6148 family protein [Chengkuizengella sp. 2205SS18-9]
MSWTIDTAKTHLESWLKAELAVSTGQSYRIGSRELRRADLNEIRKQILFWSREVKKLEKNPRRVRRIVPID